MQEEMNFDIRRSEIVTATELSKNTAAILEKARTSEKVVIFKNNKPDVVILNAKEYDKLIKNQSK